MKIAAPYQKQLSKKFKIIFTVSGIVSLLALIARFTPRNFVFPFEVRSVVLEMLTSDTFCLINLFVCLCCLMIMVMRYDNKWLSGAAMLFFPFLLIPVGLMLFLSFIFASSGWSDDKIYKNGNEYLICEVYPTREMDWTRTIKTHSAYSAIRYIWQVNDITNDNDIITGDTILYEGKIWVKEKNSGLSSVK